MPKKQKNKTTLTSAALAGSILATLYFQLVLVQLVRDVPYGVLGAPATFAALLAFVLGAYSWTHTKSVKQKYVLVALATALITGYVVWFLGLTHAKTYLPNNIEPIQSENLCPDKLMLSGQPSPCD